TGSAGGSAPDPRQEAAMSPSPRGNSRVSHRPSGAWPVRSGWRRSWVLPLDEFAAPIALQIKQAGEAAVVQAGGHMCGDSGFGMKSNAEARFLQHGQVVRTVADSDGIGRRKAIRRAQLAQGRKLGFLAEDRRIYAAGQHGVVVREHIGRVEV